MATTLFQISPYFSFRWVDNDLVSDYNTLPLDSTIDDLSYCQPWQAGGGRYQSDTGQIQLISDFVPTCGLYDYNTNIFISNISLAPIVPPIMGVSFICYNGAVDFSDLDPGLYYAKITYVDELATPRDWRTSPLDVEMFHYGTQLFEATNTENDKGVVFVNSDLTTVVIKHRIASIIREPFPKTDAQDYEDQYNILTQESSIPFVVYSQLLGGPTLLPFWVIEKINLLYSLNKVKVDGQYFAKIANAEFKPTRAETGQQGAWWQVDIQPNNSYPSDIFETGIEGQNEYLNDKVYKTYLNQSADFAIIGIITGGINLIRIAVVNHNADVFVMKIGTSPGDNNLGQISFPDDNTDSCDIGKVFTVPTTIYISGINGTNLDITLDYNNYRAVPIAPPVKIPIFAKNTLYWFVEVVPGSFAVEFDVANGLGNVGTDHEGCVLAGTNGTPDVTDHVPRAWDRTLPLTRETSIGSDEVILLTGNITAHTHNTVNGDMHGPGGGGDLAPGQSLIRKWSAGINTDYNLQGSGTTPDRGTSSSVGNSDPVITTPLSIILPAFYYVGP